MSAFRAYEEMDIPDASPKLSPFVRVLMPTIVLAIAIVTPRWYWGAGQRRHVTPVQGYEFPEHSPVRYWSPDKSVIAVILPVFKPGIKGHESRVELRSKSGNVLVKRDYSSADGQHGYYVQKAAWTPDSNFFVYSMERSGGHQPWHSPMEFYSRSHDRIFSLDSALRGAVTNPQFLVSAPNRVTVELWFSKRTKTVSLSALVPKDDK